MAFQKLNGKNTKLKPCLTALMYGHFHEMIERVKICNYASFLSSNSTWAIITMSCGLRSRIIHAKVREFNVVSFLSFAIHEIRRNFLPPIRPESKSLWSHFNCPMGTSRIFGFKNRQVSKFISEKIFRQIVLVGQTFSDYTLSSEETL